MLRQLRIAIIFLVMFTVITGIIYPLFVTGIAQAVFPHQANGSLITENGTAVGSELIGQPFSDPRYFWGRLSATAPFPYNAAASSGSNYGPSNPALTEAIQARIDALKAVDPAKQSTDSRGLGDLLSKRPRPGHQHRGCALSGPSCGAIPRAD